MFGSLLGRIGGMRHARRMVDQRFRVAQAYGATREPERVNEGAALREPSYKLEGDKSAACGHLAPDDMNLGEIREARVINGSHRRMGRKHLGDGQASARMLRHAQFKRLQ